MKTYFTSDTHFGHANIIKYSNRPFLQPTDLDAKGKWVDESIKRQRAREHDEALITKWNTVVTNDDVVYHLGDFMFGRTDKALWYLRQLNFKKLYFIWGNHDSTMKEVKNLLRFYPDLKDRVEFLGELAEVNVEGQDIVLCHYGMRVWNASHHGAWHLYGHSHGSLKDDPHALSFDVGVDCHNYTPLSFDEVKAIMAKKFWKPIDHHGAREAGGGIGLNKQDYAKLERYSQYLALCKEFAGENYRPYGNHVEEGSEQKAKEE